MFPRPPKPERGTARARRHMELVAQSPCVICGRWPVVVHHVIHDRHSQRRASDLDTIPLCPIHHDALHADPAGWRAVHGPDHRFLALTRATIREYERRTV